VSAGVRKRRFPGVVGAVAILVGSYLLAGFVNAAPVTQPALTGRYSQPRIILVTPPAAADVVSPTPAPVVPVPARQATQAI